MRDFQGQVVRFVDIRVEVVLAAIFFEIVILEVDRLVHCHIDSTLFSGIIFCEGGLLNLHFFPLVRDISIDDPTFPGKVLVELRVQNLGVDIFQEEHSSRTRGLVVKESAVGNGHVQCGWQSQKSFSQGAKKCDSGIRIHTGSIFTLDSFKYRVCQSQPGIFDTQSTSLRELALKLLTNLALFEMYIFQLQS